MLRKAHNGDALAFFPEGTFTREPGLKRFRSGAFVAAARAGLPVVPDSCPACFTAPTQRAHMKSLLAREERGNPHLFANLLHAMRPLLTEEFE